MVEVRGTNEGVRRLGLVLGLLGLAIWAGASGLYAYSAWYYLAPFSGELEEAKRDLVAYQEAEPLGEEEGQEKVDGVGLSKSDSLWLEGVDIEGRIERAEQHNEQRRTFYLLVSLGAIASFTLPWGTVRVIAWIIEGFRRKET